jgi:hypothetical protein
MSFVNDASMGVISGTPNMLVTLFSSVPVEQLVPAQNDQLSVVVHDHSHGYNPHGIFGWNDCGIVCPSGISNNQPKNEK